MKVFPTPLAVTSFGETLDNLKRKVKSGSSSDVPTVSDPNPDAMITDVLFEQVGGIELAVTTRHDVMAGIVPNRSIIKNVLEVNEIFNSKNIIFGGTGEEILDQFTSDVSRYLGKVYFDGEGNLVIETDDSVGFLDILLLVDGIIYRTQ